MRDKNGTRLRQVLRAFEGHLGGLRTAHATSTEALDDEAAPGKLERRTSASVKPPPSDGSLCVLVVEDNPGDALLIRKALTDGSSTTIALENVASLRAAIAACTQRPFDAVVLDLGLPDARGLRAMTELRTLVPSTPIVVVSGDRDENVAIEAVRLGAQDYVLKDLLPRSMLHRRLRYAIERSRHEEALEHMAHFDDLTGLANRGLFFDRVDHAIARAQRGQSKVALLFLDLDHFKELNDGYGHAAGDSVLEVVARRIEGALRQCDTVAVMRSPGRDTHIAARLGGDEFAVLLEDFVDRSSVASVMARLGAALREPIPLNGQSFSPTTSIGAALYPDDGASRAELLASADMAMYRAKRLTSAADQVPEPRARSSSAPSQR